jgi:glycerol-1-phosphate dehydrogenase [NAD(P)+]
VPLLARAVMTPLTIDVRRGAIAGLGELLVARQISAGGDVAVVVGPGLGEQIAEILAPSLNRAEIISTAGGTLDSALDLADKLKGRHLDAVIAIGGGKTIDTTKFAASRLGLPMVTVATSLANDGLASPTASLEHEGMKPSYGVHIPLAVFVDLDFVESGPDSQTRAGIGDALSNLSAIADWELAGRERGERIDGLAVSMARIGAEALINHPGEMTEDGFLTVLAEALIMGGIAMSVAGTSRPVSGGCHEISHAIDLMYPRLSSHGEQVGLGALFCTFLRGDERRFAQMARVLNRHGLPRTPEEIGLTAEEFVAVALFAPRTRPERFTILEHLDLDEQQLRRRVADYVGALA